MQFEIPTLQRFFEWHGAVICQQRQVLPFHKKIFAALTRWVGGKLPDGKRHLAICMPPRHGKTYIARDLIAWAIGAFPDSEWIYTSYSSTLAIAQTVQIRDWIASDHYRKIFPYVGLEPKVGRQDYFQTPAGGSVYGVGVGGTITGFGAGKKRQGFGGGIVIDDPLLAQDAYSEAKREACNLWYTQTLYSRRNSDKTPVLLIMQRLHELDLVGYLQRNESDIWHVLQIPVWIDKQESDTIWPETFSKESAERLRDLDAFAFNSQYLQQPTPAGGALFPREHLLRIDAEPTGLIRAGIFCDTAMKTGEANDYSVLTYAATDGRVCYILDIDRGRWTAPDLLAHAKAFWQKHMPHRTKNPVRFLGMHIEDKASGTGLIQTLRAETAIPIIPIQRSRDKVSRAHDILPYVASDRLCFRSAPWTDAAIGEMCSFSPSMAHEHDDQVDTIIDAVSTLLVPDIGLLAGADWS